MWGRRREEERSGGSYHSSQLSLYAAQHKKKGQAVSRLRSVFLSLSSFLCHFLPPPPSSLQPLLHSPCQSVPPSLPAVLLPSLSLSASLCHWRVSQCENAILLSGLLPLTGCGGKRLVCVCLFPVWVSVVRSVCVWLAEIRIFAFFPQYF